MSGVIQEAILVLGFSPCGVLEVSLFNPSASICVMPLRSFVCKFKLCFIFMSSK